MGISDACSKIKLTRPEQRIRF